MKNNQWKFCTGEIIVKVKAIDYDGRFRTFEVRTFRDKTVDDYDFVEALDDLARVSAALRNCYRAEIVHVGEV